MQAHMNRGWSKKNQGRMTHLELGFRAFDQDLQRVGSRAIDDDGRELTGHRVAYGTNPITDLIFEDLKSGGLHGLQSCLRHQLIFPRP
jgi:hypothetical protein